MSKDAVVLVFGADALNKPLKAQPPLDRGFFANTLRSKSPHTWTTQTMNYMKKHYGTDIAQEGNDSLEMVMAVLYADIYGGALAEEAFPVLRGLIMLFLRRLAETTNDIPMTRKSFLYRIIVRFLNAGVRPRNLTIVSFNQDIQAEKALEAIAARQGRAGEDVFTFPNCYQLPKSVRVTEPTRSSTPKFERTNGTEQGVSILKLHGSLNWYSRHNTPQLIK